MSELASASGQRPATRRACAARTSDKPITHYGGAAHVSDTDLSPSWHRLASRLLGGDEASLVSASSTPGELFPGRHSNRTEIAAETPIFHDLTLRRLTHGRSRPVPAGRIPAPRTDPLTEFRRNPLTAPIPVQV